MQSYAHEAGLPDSNYTEAQGQHLTFSTLSQNDAYGRGQTEGDLNKQVNNNGSNLSVNCDDTTAVITVPNGIHKANKQSEL